ncbi:MAG: coenzyme F430 synthase [Euryarchaeota archaeon]|nr:coenzyme F430 synthase [Euryarchaeota archaeon]
MKVLILDLVHGGEVLAQTYADRGDDVTAVDVYQTSTAELRNNLSTRGIRVLNSSPPEQFDLGVAPIHCPDHFYNESQCKRKLTHHQAVGELVKFPFPVIEVTGAHGKTSTCQLIAQMLANYGKRVLLLTSGGLGIVYADGIRILKEKVSIAPPTILDISSDKYDVDVGVFEVSLGGTGADISVITTIGDNYPIAGNTKRAIDGKIQIIQSARGAVIFPEEERGLWKPHVTYSEVVTFGSEGTVQTEFKELSLERQSLLHVDVGGESITAKLSPNYLASAYSTVFGAAIATAWSMGAPLDSISNALQSFDGVRGRGEVTIKDDHVLVQDRNPGVSATSIDWNLHCLSAYGYRDIGLVIEPINYKVCQKLDLPAVRSVVDEYSEVNGIYIISSDGSDFEGFKSVRSVEEVTSNHQATLWCIKEGYL